MRISRDLNDPKFQLDQIVLLPLRLIRDIAEHLEEEEKQRININAFAVARIGEMLIGAKQKKSNLHLFLPFPLPEHDGLMPSTSRLLRTLIEEKRLPRKVELSARVTLGIR